MTVGGVQTYRLLPRVSVILPVYNGADYLRESIDSVLRQSFTDFELLILDDCSADHSREIAQATDDARVRSSHNGQRRGLFATLNRGFRESRGPLVRLWAQDDRMLPNCLERFVAYADRHSTAGIYFCNFFEFDAAGRRTGHEEVYRACRQRTPEACGSEIAALLLFAYGCLPGNISTVMLRKEASDSVGGFWEGVQQAPDYDMWVRVTAHWPMVFIDEKLVELRDHPAQQSKRGMRSMATATEEVRVYHTLAQRLQGIVEPREMMAHWRHHRGRQHVHWLTKALLRGDWSTARRGWRAIRSYGQPWRQILFWLCSANGRFRTRSCDEFFDKIIEARASSTPTRMRCR